MSNIHISRDTFCHACFSFQIISEPYFLNCPTNTLFYCPPCRRGYKEALISPISTYFAVSSASISSPSTPAASRASLYPQIGQISLPSLRLIAGGAVYFLPQFLHILSNCFPLCSVSLYVSLPLYFSEVLGVEELDEALAVVCPSAIPSVLSFTNRIFTVAKMILMSSAKLGLLIYIKSMSSLS